MRILLLAPSNYEFSFEICKELEGKRHIVKFIEDKTFECDYYLSHNNKAKRILKYLIGKSTKAKNIYWQRMFKDGGELYDYHCDLLLCINGYSLCERFFLQLKENNPNVRLVYYLWDSCRLYAFHKNFHYFDKCLTFDAKDAKNFQIEYLPMFWMPVLSDVVISEKPRVFFVGSIHSDRYAILKRIVRQLDNYRIDYYIKLYVPSNKIPFLKIRYNINKLFKHENCLNDIYCIRKGKEKAPFITFQPISLELFNEELIKSSCIIDIEQPCQTALAPRFIQALAYGKKIITTNQWVIKESFYNPDVISIIDRKQSNIDKKFMFHSIEPTCFKYNDLRIDKWLDHLLK